MIRHLSFRIKDLVALSFMPARLVLSLHHTVQATLILDNFITLQLIKWALVCFHCSVFWWAPSRRHQRLHRTLSAQDDQCSKFCGL